MKTSDKIGFFIFASIVFAFMFFSISNDAKINKEIYEKCDNACKNRNGLLKISTMNQFEGVVCYCETSPGIIDEVKVENGR